VTEPVVHSTFSIEQAYPVPPPRVFAAFADQQRKRRWFAEGEGWEVEEFTLDFRVGGFERSRFRFLGNPAVPPAPMRNDTLYLDIVPDRRIVFAYSMTMNDRRISASLASVELTPDGDGTRLKFTEQAAFFEGGDGPRLRQRGWGTLFDRLGETLRKHQGD
jgi:uncharacterized protein YndB with AHSA1/START domain